MMPTSAVDVLLVGAGLTAAAVAARLRQVRPCWRLLAVDARPHLAGNCFDEMADHGTRVHRYGPHVFHSPSERIVEFLSDFTAWLPLRDAVTAEVEIDERIVAVPFLYSGRTAAALGRRLTGDEVIDVFFRGYSEKMWGRAWDALPPAVRARVPLNGEHDVRRAMGLASDVAALSHQRSRLRDEFNHSVLADATRYTRALEAAYRQMRSISGALERCVGH